MAGLKAAVRAVLRRVVPLEWRRWLRRKALLVGHPLHLNQRRVTPVSRNYGYGRGNPVDRYYIEQFLWQYSGDIKGCVLEVKDARYTTRIGAERVVHSEILDVDRHNSAATICADLAQPDQVPAAVFDCIICTQTLMLIYDLKAAVQSLWKMLKPGGVVLVTIPGISQICRYEMDQCGDHWRFTDLSAQRLVEEFFPAQNVTVKPYGNVLAATAFLYGLSQEELRTVELDYHDPDYQVTIGVRAVKPM